MLLVADSLAKQIGLDDPVILTEAQIRQMSDAALFHQAMLLIFLLKWNQIRKNVLSCY